VGKNSISSKFPQWWVILRLLPLCGRYVFDIDPTAGQKHILAQWFLFNADDHYRENILQGGGRVSRGSVWVRDVWTCE
jgi:hypothetical protein